MLDGIVVVLGVEGISSVTFDVVVFYPIECGGYSPLLFGGLAIFLTYFLFGIDALFLDVPLFNLMQQSLRKNCMKN